MQCACPECDILMGWREKGILSECKCPVCGYRCSACMGTKDVLSPEELRAMAGLWGLEDGGPLERGRQEGRDNGG